MKSKRENNRAGSLTRKIHSRNSSMAFITLDVSKKGHMAAQCPTITSPCLFMIEVQNSQDRVTIKEEVGQQVHNNDVPTKGDFHEENEHDEIYIENNEDEEDILYFNDEHEVNNDEPAVYLDVMHKDERSFEDEYIIYCAMMYEESNLPELEELETSYSNQGEWDWLCQYVAMHNGHYEECSL